ncbi:MAG: YncE family protein [Planctomycetota bacterium]|nr:YncE family protein [Planctomycetota bacterium]
MTPHLVAAALVLTAVSSARSEEAAPLRLTQTIPLEGVEGRIDHLGVDLDGGRLFVAALGNNTLEVIDLATGKRIQSIGGLKEPQGVAVVAETRQVVVASGGDSICRIYDRALNPPSVIERLDDADNVRFCPSDKRIYVGYSNALSVIDPTKAVVVDRINLDGHPESFQIEAKGTRIFVNVPTAGHVAVVDRVAKKVVAKWPLAHARSNYPLALDETGHRLFVGCRWPAVTVVLDTETGKQVARLDCCGDTDDIFYDAVARRLYVVGGEGCISVYHQDDADHYSPMPKVATASGARTALFVPQTGLLYVAVPRRHGQNAEIRVFARGPGPLP